MIYLDSCIVIYAVEDDGPRGNAVRQRLTESADAVVAVSPLVTLECLVGPLRDENFGLHDHYLRALHNFKPLPLETEHYARAAELRARYGLRTPDALHLAAAAKNLAVNILQPHGNRDLLCSARAGASSVNP